MEIAPCVRGMQPRRGCQCVNKNRIQSTLTNREKLNSQPCLWALVWECVPGQAFSYLPDMCDYLIHRCEVCVAVTVLTGTVFVEVPKCVLDFRED